MWNEQGHNMSKKTRILSPNQKNKINKGENDRKGAHKKIQTQQSLTS